jgi:hypothetical protein
MPQQRLVLVLNDRPPVRPFEPPPFSLLMQPQRPGELCESLVVKFPQEALAHAEQHAQAVRLPLTLWLAIAIEAERALVAAVAATGVESTELIAAADDAARPGRRYDVAPLEARRLASYAEALRVGVAGTSTAEKVSVAVRLPHLLLARWAFAACEVNMSLGEWVTTMPLAPGRERWEAAAAEAALPLGEWLLVQAARLARSTSTAPQPAA